MLRQRLKVAGSPLALLGRAVLVVFALALIWYGLMLVLLVFGVSPEAVNDVSGYRTAHDYLAGLTPEDITDTTRLIVGLAGLGAFLLFGYLAARELPRPYLARSGLRIAEDERGSVEVGARAVERVAEVAAVEHPAVNAVAGRLEDEEVTVNVTVTSPRGVDETLADVHRRVREALTRHDLGDRTVNVTVTGFDRQRRRELS
jgi:hypothetical protein